MAACGADFIVVGAGIAGASVAYELSAKGTVILLEMESSPGYHSTGRSAAVISENYGPALWSRLVTASRSFLETPPDGFAEVPLVSPRGALFLARDGEVDGLRHTAEELTQRGASIELMSADEAVRHCPVLRTSEFAHALYEPGCMDIDTDALLSSYLRAFRSRGGQFFPDARVERLSRSRGRWAVTTPKGVFEAAVVVNAAGGWVQQVGNLAGLSNRNVVPFRRTAVTFDPPAGRNIHRWPITFDVAETFYFKPEAGRIMVSPGSPQWRSARSSISGADREPSRRIMSR
jgi:D-arginine dehydrogenase